MRITCPHCGDRTSEEFSYLGDATKQRPQGTLDVKVWNDYVHIRANPHGKHRELWQHSPCRTWIVVTRDVTTHEIFGVELPSPPPSPASGRADTLEPAPSPVQRGRVGAGASLKGEGK